MMAVLLEFKQLVQNFYLKYDIYVKAVWKFAVSLLSFLLINTKLGFMPQLRSPLVSLGLAAVCAFLPINMAVLFGALLTIVHAYALSLEICAVIAGILSVMYLLYFRISSKLGYILMLMPLCFVMGIPCAVPLLAGMLYGPAAAVPVGFGTVSYYLLTYMSGNSTSLGVSEAAGNTVKAVSFLGNIISNKEMFLTILAMVLTVLVVYAIRRMAVDYSWEIAILSGGVVNVVIRLLGAFLPGVTLKILSLIPGSIISIILAFVVKFFVFSVDYARTERLQFEDDEYYYYVKAIPKNTIAASEKRVKKIMPQKKQTRVVKKIDS